MNFHNFHDTDNNSQQEGILSKAQIRGTRNHNKKSFNEDVDHRLMKGNRREKPRVRVCQFSEDFSDD